jgi:putative membrane protein
MKLTPILILRSAIAAFAVCVLSPAVYGQVQDRSTSDSPFLRAKDKPTPSPTATVAPKIKLSDKDKNFLVTAASISGTDLENAKMAQNKAKNAETKKIAARMIASHTKLNQELVDLAKKKGVAVTPPNQGQAITDWDKEYLGQVQRNHAKAISAFEKEAQSGNDPEIKAWAKKMLPTLE